MKAQDSNSRRAKRRANRVFKGSRPNRRAEKRLAICMASYDRGVAVDKSNGGRSYVKPGKQKKW